MHALILWVPVLAGDDTSAASRQAGTWRDERVDHCWDGNKLVGPRFQSALGLHGPAWDIYLLYRPGVRWNDELPPVPNIWTHQIPDDAGADPDRCLDPMQLGRELDTLRQE
jgi:hypothetical protein